MTDECLPLRGGIEVTTIGIVGCGYWGINYVRVFDEIPASTVTRVCDMRGDRLALVKQRYPLVNTHSTIQDLVCDDQLDAVVVATPAASHHAIAKECLEAGKHVLLEKPLTVSVEQAEDLIRSANRADRVLMVGHTFLYNSGIGKMKELAGQEGFGTLYYLHATRTNLGPIRQDVDAVWDLAPHDVAIFGYLLDARPFRVSAVGGRWLSRDRYDVAFVTLTYPGGIIGNIHVSWADPNKVREVVAVGSKRRVVFDDLNNLERIRVFEKGVAPSEKEAGSFGEYRLLIRDGDIISPRIEPSEPLKNQGMHFLECIVEGKKPVSDGASGRDVVRVMEAIDQSLQSDGQPVDISWGENNG
jgi:predicted dehydrogenase